MTRNPILYAVALAIPLMMSFSNPDKGICKPCRYFDDGVDKHKELAKNSSIGTPASNYSVLKTYVASNKLVKLNSGTGFVVSKMSYSYPYVTSKAHQFIDQLGQAYKARCKQKGIAYLPFVITSATRTKETVARLTRVNRNAIPESAHLYGTTFDVSWIRFGTDRRSSPKNLNALIDVLVSMRDKGLCFVKFERRQACFHITVNEDKIGTDQETTKEMAVR